MTRKFTYLAIILVALITVVEVGLHAADAILNLSKKDEGKKIYMLPQFADKKWAKGLFKEVDALEGEYKAYRGWGKNEFKGEYINIGPDGARKTWNPEDLKENARTVYVMGGSTTWGYGARDYYTVPSYISKLLNSTGYEFRVYNYGEWAYSFTQSIYYLITLLRDGHRPDYVIFYGGTDVYNSYQSGRVGLLQHAFIRGSTEDVSNFQRIKSGLLNIIKAHSMIYRELKKIKSKFEPPKEQFQEAAHNYDDARLKQLGMDTATYFEESHVLLEKLATAYNFKYVSVWPPVTFTEEKLLEAEATTDERLHDQALKKIYGYVVADLNTKSISHFYNISDVLKDRTKPYYIDSGHVIEEGNKVVAEKIVSILKKDYLLNE